MDRRTALTGAAAVLATSYLRAPEEWQPGTVSQWDTFKELQENG